MKLSSSYPILELAGFTGLPYGVLLTASDCLRDKHNGHCNAAWKIIRGKLDERQQVLLCFVLLSVAVGEYSFPLAVMATLAANQPAPLASPHLESIVADVYVIDFGQ